MRILALCLIWIVSASANAASGADDLLKTLGGESKDVVGSERDVGPAGTQGKITINNSVARKLYLDWTNQKGLSFEVHAWVKGFFDGNFQYFAHQKSAMSKFVPAGMKNSAEAAYLYSLYKLNLPQTFLNQWLSANQNHDFFNSSAAQSLEEAIASGFDQWLVDHQVKLSESQKSFLNRIEDGKIRSETYLNLIAYSKVRKGLAAQDVLSRLSVNNALRPVLAKTVALALARKGDLGGAAKVLKQYYEPSILSKGDVKALSNHYLQIARFLYQAGSIDGAIQYYEKIPTGTPEFITAREELGWCWLRKGEISKLRGNVVSLTSKVLGDQFHPESYLVRAISNLKLCQYPEVQKDLKEFQAVHGPWAKIIEQGIQYPETNPARNPDVFTLNAAKALNSRLEEKTKLDSLYSESVNAGLPAVGHQIHWKQASDQIANFIEESKKEVANENRRQWKSDKIILSEAIRKMQFVKVELLSQVSVLTGTEVVNTSASSANRVSETEKNKLKDTAELVFPFDGTMWPDEVFKLRSVAESKCGNL